MCCDIHLQFSRPYGKILFYIYFLEPNKSNKNDVGKKKTRNWLNFESEEEEEEENILISQYSRQSQS